MTPPVAVFACIVPRASLTVDPLLARDDQHCAAIYHLTLAQLPDGIHQWANGLWGLECTLDCLSRILERDRQADLDQVILSAHRSLIAAPIAAAEPEETRLIPAGNGVLLGEATMGRMVITREPVFHYRCRTWLHRDQLSEAQDREILPRVALGVSLALGDSCLLPASLAETKAVKRPDGKWRISFKPLMSLPPPARVSAA